MKKTNLKHYANSIQSAHFNTKLLDVNDHCLRIAVNEDSMFEWHYHKQSEELFIVLEGNLIIEFQDKPSVSLLPMDSLTVPAGVIHRTLAVGRTVNFCIEKDADDTVFV